MSEADNICDIGGEFAKYDYLLEVRADLEEDRSRRLKNIKGKYVVICDGKNKLLYLQDRRISKNHYWTQYIANAITFSDLNSAKTECLKLKFNNPRVALVDSEHKLCFY